MGLNLLEDIKIRSGREQTRACSWMGKLNTIKMSILPYFRHRFNNIQTGIPTVWFKKKKENLDKTTPKFMWQNNQGKLEKERLGAFAFPEIRT